MDAFAFQPTHIPGDGRHSPDRHLEISDDFPGRFSAKHLHVVIFNALEAVFVGDRIHNPPKPREAVGECSVQVKYCELVFRHDPSRPVPMLSPGFSILLAGTSPRFPSSRIDRIMEAKMGRGLLLWLLGVPIPVILLLWLFFGR